MVSANTAAARDSRRRGVALNALAKAQYLVEQLPVDPADRQELLAGAVRQLIVAVRGLLAEQEEMSALAAELRRRFPL